MGGPSEPTPKKSSPVADMLGGGCLGDHAPVAQRIEHLTTDQKVGGSSPSGRARTIPADPLVTKFCVSRCGNWTLSDKGHGVVVHTLEHEPYGCFILTKGVVFDADKLPPTG